MTDLVIIGGGPAGLSAAVYAARAGISVFVIEKMNCGGQITLSGNVENYIGTGIVSGQQLADTMRQQAEDNGVKIILDDIKRVVKNGKRFIAVSARNSYECNCIIIANGVQPRRLGCVGEEDFIGKGVSWCAMCDGPLYRDMNVAVIGGGESACEEALALSKICKSVYLIHYKKEFSASAVALERISKVENIIEFKPYEVISVNGDAENERVSRITVKNTEDEKTYDIEVSGVFVAIGYIPDNYRFSELVELDSKGYIVTNNSNCTSCEGVFAAGDTIEKELRQLVTAVADGANAANLAKDYILTLAKS